jgi:putative chitinase
MILSSGQIEQLLHGNKDWKSWEQPLKDILAKYQINTPQRIAMFIAQCGHESLNFTVLEENLNYSAKGLNAVFGKYFQRAGRDANAFHRQPERIANVVYADRMGNSNAASGDGWKYRGRGVIQLTGAHNYAMFADAVGKKLSQIIEYVSTKDGALESACWFWNKNDLNRYADNGDIKNATKRINGGYNGLSDREHHYHRAMSVLDGSYKPQTAPVLLKVGSKGPEVIKVQEGLNLDADGVYGLMTKEAVMYWQRKNDLTEDGIVGPKTYAALIGE